MRIRRNDSNVVTVFEHQIVTVTYITGTRYNIIIYNNYYNNNNNVRNTLFITLYISIDGSCTRVTNLCNVFCSMWTIAPRSRMDSNMQPSCLYTHTRRRRCST